jgi:putative hydrolase of the HAD superfamily
LIYPLKKLYVLDLDDTLYLEKDFVRSGFKAVDTWLSNHAAIDNFFETAWELFQEGARGDIFNRAMEASGLYTEKMVLTLVSVYRNHLPEISLLSDAVEFLNSFPKKRLALITDGYPEVQWNKVNALGLKECIGKIVVTGDWGRTFWKPNPKAFVEVSRGCNPEGCIYIGDNPEKDFHAPRVLNWSPSIRIKRYDSLHYSNPTPPDCMEIASLMELIESDNVRAN